MWSSPGKIWQDPPQARSAPSYAAYGSSPSRLSLGTPAEQSPEIVEGVSGAAGSFEAMMSRIAMCRMPLSNCRNAPMRMAAIASWYAQLGALREGSTAQAAEQLHE